MVAQRTHAHAYAHASAHSCESLSTPEFTHAFTLAFTHAPHLPPHLPPRMPLHLPLHLPPFRQLLLKSEHSSAVAFKARSAIDSFSEHEARVARLEEELRHSEREYRSAKGMRASLEASSHPRSHPHSQPRSHTRCTPPPLATHSSRAQAELSKTRALLAAGREREGAADRERQREAAVVQAALA